ncbi:MAG: alpha/beta fold hydrolase, partial [Acutalibacteraceae bacterium]
MKLIDEKNFEAVMKNEVEPYLESIRKDDCFESFDGNKIHFEAYEHENAKAAVIVLHGFTESAEKFREVSYYFYSEGYSVFTPDLRGHGKSYRASKKTGTVNAESFDEYAKDLDALIEKVVLPSVKDKDIYIYSHSLGSTAALLYMQKNPGTVRKAVLSSPMLCGNMGMPVGIAKTVASVLCALGGKNISAPGRCKFDPDQTVENSDDTSEERFNYYHEKRKNDSLLQTNGPSFGWVKASLEARDSIFKEENLKRLTMPILLLKPQEDRQVLESWQDKFAERVKTVHVVNIPDSKHEIFGSENKTLAIYYREIFGF